MKSFDNFKRLKEYITFDDLPEDLKFIATFCGMEVAIILIKYAAGMNFNIPKSCLNGPIRKYIIDNYNGTRANILEISHVCDVTERHIRKVIKEHVENTAKSE